MTTWFTRTLRLTLLLSPSANQTGARLAWKKLTGKKPDKVTRHGNEQFAEGLFPPGRLLVQVRPSRLDVISFGLPESNPRQADRNPSLGPFEAASAKLRGLAEGLFADPGPYLSMALAAELVSPAETRVAAYRILVDHMGSATFNLEGGQEFLYEINRPRGSKVIAQLVVNRLTRWAATSWHPFVFETGIGPRLLSGPKSIGAVITPDIFTDTDRVEPLPPDRLRDLFSELCDMIVEIRDRGDIP
jgi:hypothetical protein